MVGPPQEKGVDVRCALALGDGDERQHGIEIHSGDPNLHNYS